MAARYHISNGRIMRCEARLKPCPLGGEHYSSKAEAALHIPELTYSLAVSNAVNEMGRDKMESNAEYAEFLKKFEAENGHSATSVYHSHAGAIVSRASMIEEIKRYEARDIQSGMHYNSDLISDLRYDLYKADAAALREKKENFRAAYEAYRAEHGPVARPNFQQLVADAEARKAAKAAERAAATATREEQLAKISEARAKREQSEDVISFGKARKQGVAKDSHVPAAVIGDFVGEASESIADFFGEASSSVRDLFNRSH